jgi:hypothetical protein
LTTLLLLVVVVVLLGMVVEVPEVLELELDYL